MKLRPEVEAALTQSLPTQRGTTKVNRLSICLILLLCTAWRFPPGSNVVDVTEMGAIPNDGLSDAAAFQHGITTRAANYGHILYVPAGVYDIPVPLVSKVLHGTPPTLKWAANLIIMCEEGAVLRVPAGSPAFANAAAPQALIQYASTQNNAPNPGSGGGDEAYRNTLDGCVIEDGGSNPGLNAVSWTCNNRGAIRDVEIRFAPGSGNIGITSLMFPGPCLIVDTKITGGNRAIVDPGLYYGWTYKNVEISGQRVFGIEANGNTTVIDGLRSTNTVPAVRATGAAAHLTLLDATLEGGAANRSAVELGAATRALLRDITSAGYQSAVKRGATVLPGAAVSEYLTHAAHSLFDPPAGTLRLPVLPVPTVYKSQREEDWADPRDYGANAADALDDRAGVQAALDSGQPIVFLPQGTPGVGQPLSSYRISGPLTVPCTVRRIVGMESKLIAHGTWPAGEPLFRLADACNWSDTLVVENLWATPNLQGGYMFDMADGRNLYIRDAQINGNNPGIRTYPTSGKLFLENVVLRELTIDGSEAWAWQLNSESILANPGIEVTNGGKLRVAFLKTEGMKDATLKCVDSECEVLGGKLMACIGQGLADIVGPAIRFEDSDASINYTNACGKPDIDLATWDVQVEETRAGVTLNVPYSVLPDYYVEGGHHLVMPLYTSRGKSAQMCEVE